MPTLTELTVLAQKRYRGVTAERLCYLTDGLTLPKMYDGTTLVNWGIEAPTTAPVAAGTSTGAVSLDTCDTLWTPVSLTLDSCEDVWTIASSIDSSLEVLATLSADSKVGSSSALLLIGTSSEPITTSTKLMLHFNGIDAEQATIDSSSSNRTVTFGANAYLDTAKYVFGTSSLLLDGSTTSNITVPDSTAWDIGTGSFEIDFRIFFTALTASTTDIMGGSNSPGIILDTASGNFRVRFNNGAVTYTFAHGFSTGQWYHMLVKRSGGVLQVCKDGVQIGSDQADTTSIAHGAGTLTIGCYSGSLGVNGWIDEFRFDIGGSSKYPVFPFIVPTSEYGSFAELSNDPEGVTGLVMTEDLASAQDLSTYWGLEFWTKSAKALADGDLSLVLYDSTSGTSELERCSIPALNPGEWTKVKYQFQSPATLTSVASIGIAVNRDRGMNAIYLDDILSIRCNITLDTLERVEGKASVKIEIPGNVADNTLVAYKTLASTNMVADTAILLNLRSNKYLGYQVLQYLLDDTAACASPLESLYITPDLAENTWQQLNLTLAAPGSDTAIISEGLKVIKRSAAPLTIWLDDIRRATTVAGNLTGRYYTWVSFYASKYDRESDLGLISNVVDAQGQSISLSSIPVSTDMQVDMRRIYRSQAGGTVPYLEKTIENNTATTASLTLSDAALGLARRHPSGEAGSGKYAMPYASPYILSYRNTIILAGSIPYALGTANVTNLSATVTLNSPGVVNQSMVGKEFRVSGDTQKYLIESVNVTGNTFVIRPIDNLVSGVYKGSNNATAVYQIIGDENAIHTSFIDDDNISRYHGFPAELVQTIIDGKPGEKITALGLVGDVFLVSKQTSTWIGEGNYAPWSTNRISSSVGCASQDTMVQDELGNAVWLAGEQGIATCDGFTVSLISEMLIDLFNGSHELGFNTTKFSQAHAVYDTTKRWLWLFITSKTATTNDVCIIWDRSNLDSAQWKWYYFTGIEAMCSAVVYDDNNVASIYIGDYDGFISQLWVGYNDGVQTGTLSGVVTAGSASNTLVDSTATFATTGDGLKAMQVVKYIPSTGVFESKKILSNTGTALTITGTWTATPAAGDKYYVGSYELDWKSKNFQFARNTDKNMIHDLRLNHQDATTSQNLRIRLSKNLGKDSIANQTIDLVSGEEKVLLVRQRVQQTQIRLSGYSQGQEFEINNLSIRFTKRGVK